MATPHAVAARRRGIKYITRRSAEEAHAHEEQDAQSDDEEAAGDVEEEVAEDDDEPKEGAGAAALPSSGSNFRFLALCFALFILF